VNATKVAFSTYAVGFTNVTPGRGSAAKAERDGRMARAAARQHGVIAVTQLQRIGFTAREVEVRVRAGRLHQIHRGVHAVGHQRLTIQGHRMAAVLFGGSGTVLSHRPAGAEWDHRRWSGAPAITVPSRRRPSGLIPCR
jgi:hypothetical protein